VNGINLSIQLALNFTKHFANLFNMLEFVVSQLQTLLQSSHNLHCLCQSGGPVMVCFGARESHVGVAGVERHHDLNENSENG
jgi:hypothetical protein